MTILSNKPLSKAEFRELDEFLMSDDTPDDCMDISMLDGYFAALAIRPEMLMPSRWLPAVWGSDEHVFNDMEQVNRIYPLLMRYYNEVVGDLRAAPDEFEPVFYERKQQGEVSQIIEAWCAGFICGLRLHNPSWAAWLQDTRIARALTPFLLFGTEEGLDEVEKSGQQDQARAEAIAAIGPSLQALFDAFRKPAPRRASGPGRNDSCPCGSGRKYKRCCGGTAH